MPPHGALRETAMSTYTPSSGSYPAQGDPSAQPTAVGHVPAPGTPTAHRPGYGQPGYGAPSWGGGYAPQGDGPPGQPPTGGMPGAGYGAPSPAPRKRGRIGWTSGRALGVQGEDADH
jgi:hypothetical protein